MNKEMLIRFPLKYLQPFLWIIFANLFFILAKSSTNSYRRSIEEVFMEVGISSVGMTRV